MHRQFATVEGNGKDTLATLIHKHARYRHYTPILQQHNQKQRDRIIPLGEVISIMPFGAHSRGTLFEDRSKYTTRAIEEQIDMIAQRIPGFYI